MRYPSSCHRRSSGPKFCSSTNRARDKYTVGERDVQCRAAWYLKGIDVNEAGQVHAYICYLRNLPYSEQLHWASFNEEPKSKNIVARRYPRFQG